MLKCLFNGNPFQSYFKDYYYILPSMRQCPLLKFPSRVDRIFGSIFLFNCVMSSHSVIEMNKIHTTNKLTFASIYACFLPNPVTCCSTLVDENCDFTEHISFLLKENLRRVSWHCHLHSEWTKVHWTFLLEHMRVKYLLPNYYCMHQSLFKIEHS